MIRAARVLVSGSISVPNVKIFGLEDQNNKGIFNVFEDEQLCIQDSAGSRYLIASHNITEVQLKPISGIPIAKDLIRVQRIVLSGEVIHSPAAIIPAHKYEALGIPNIFGDELQLAFYASDGLYVVSDAAVVFIQL